MQFTEISTKSEVITYAKKSRTVSEMTYKKRSEITSWEIVKKS